MSEYMTNTKNISMTPVNSGLFDTIETIVLSIVLIFSTITNNSVGIIALFLYFMVAIFFRSTKYIMPYLMFLVPNLGVIQLPALGVPMVNILIVVAVLKIMTSWENLYFNRETLFLMYILIAYEMSHIVIYDYFNLIRLILWLVAILFITFVSSMHKEKYDHKLVINYYLVGLITSIWIGIFSMEGLDQGLSRFHGASGDPNYLSLYILIGLFAVLKIITYEKNQLAKLFYYFTLIFMSIFGFLTLSRMFILVFFLGLFMFVIYLIFTPKLKSVKRNMVLILLLTLVVFLFLPSQYKTLLVDSFQFTINRFVQNTGNLDELTSDRNVIGSNILAFLNREPRYMFFGVGIQEYYMRIPNIQEYAHNILLEMLVAMGIIGSIIFILFIISLVSNERSHHPRPKLDFISLLPIIIMFGSYMLLNAIEIESFYILLIFCIKHLYADSVRN